MNMDAALRIKADVQGENNIRRLGNSMQGLQGRVKNTTMAVQGLTASMKALGGIIAGTAIVAGLTGMVRQGLEAGDALGKLSARTGVATGALIGLQNAAKLSDVSAQGLEKGLQRLNLKMDAAAKGNEAAAGQFRRLGVEIKNTDGTVKTADQVLKDLGDRFRDMPNGAEKAATAVALFGKSGAELIPLLNGGREAMEAFNYELSDEFAARSEQFNDTMTILGFKSEGFRLQLTDALLPALQGILNAFSDLFDTKNDWSALFEVIKGGLRVVASAIMATVALVDQLVKATVNGFTAIQLAIQGDFEGAGRALQAGIQQAIETDAAYLRRFEQIWTDAPAPAAVAGSSSRQARVGEMIGGGSGAGARSAAARPPRQAVDISREELLYRTQLVQAREEGNKLVEAAIQLELDLLAASKMGETPNKQRLATEEALARYRKAERDFAEETGREVAKDFNQRRELAGEFQRTMEDLKIQAGEITGEKLKELQINRQIEDILKRFPGLTQEQIDKVRELVKAAADATKSFGESFKEKLEDYAKSVKDIGGAVGDAVVNAFKGMEDALTEFVTTGKANFADLARSILADLARIAIRAAIIQPLLNAFGGGLGLKLFANGGIMTGQGEVPLKKYARGGIANSPQLAMFGEGSTPEAYVPLPDGRRIPVALKGGSGGNTTVNVSVDAKGTSVQGNSGQGEQLARAIAQAVQAELIRQKRPGGLIAA
jgi:lambda family phage tail tape measure protein